MIGGNTLATIQLKTSTEYNEIGELVSGYKDYKVLKGWLDLSNGDASTTLNAKVRESTHVFICDYVDLSGVDESNSRMIINNEVYQIQLIDNPMRLNQHLEIMLTYIGSGLNG